MIRQHGKLTFLSFPIFSGNSLLLWKNAAVSPVYLPFLWIWIP